MDNERISDLAKRLINDGYEFSKGGKIHIKPENRGKFTALKKRTGHSASWFKAHGTPAQKKMAVFALNAKKWKHGDGGLIERFGVEKVKNALEGIRSNRFEGGGKTVRQTWEETTGIPWSKVGDYYSGYDGSAKRNLELLDQLNAGKYDYLSEPAPVQNEKPDKFDVSLDLPGIIDKVGNAVGNVVKFGEKAALKPVDVFHSVFFDREWRKTPAGEYVYNGVVPDSEFDLSQRAAPEEKASRIGSHINPKKITEWDDYKCAAFLTNWRMGQKGGYEFVEKNNYRGNAWSWLKNAQDAANGGADVSVDYNMYTENGFTGKEGKDEVIKRTRRLASTPEYMERMRDTIRPGSVVTLLYPSSDKFGSASKDFREGKGTTMSTHIGDIVEMDGQLYVRDNVGGEKTGWKGRIHYRPLDEVLSGKDKNGVLITGVANYGATKDVRKYYDTSEFGFGTNEYDGKGRDVTPVRSQGAVSYRMMDAMERNKSQIMEKYNIPEDEFRELQHMAIALGMQETYMQEGEPALIENGRYLPTRYLYDMYGIESHGGGYNDILNDRFFKMARLAPWKQVAEGISGKFVSDDSDKAYKWAESKGVTNVKYHGNRGDGKALFSKKEIEELGLKDHMFDERIMESPEVSGVMTIIALKKKKDEIREIMNDLPDYMRDDEDLFNALWVISWNQGTEKIRKDVKIVKNGGNPERMYRYLNADYVSSVNYYANDIIYDEKRPSAFGVTSVEELSGMDKDEIKVIQRKLVQSGYLKETIGGKNQIDGIAGKNTKAALRRYLDTVMRDSKRKEEEKKSRKEKLDEAVSRYHEVVPEDFALRAPDNGNYWLQRMP